MLQRSQRRNGLKKRGEDRAKIRGFISGINGHSFTTCEVSRAIRVRSSVVSAYLYELCAKKVLRKSVGERHLDFTKVTESLQLHSGIKRGVTREVTASYDKIVAAINSLVGKWVRGQEIATASGVDLPVICSFLHSYHGNEKLGRRGTSRGYEYRAMEKLKIKRQPTAAMSTAVWSVVSAWPDKFTPVDVIESLTKQGRPANVNTIKAILRRWHYCGYLELTRESTYLLKEGVTERPVSSSRKVKLFQPEQISA